MVDYVRALDTARRLIAANGRPVALQGASAGPADPNNPLAGPAPRPAPIVGIPAVFVQPSSLQALGMSANVQGLFAQCAAIAMCADDGIHDFSIMKTLIDDDASVWKIDRVERLKPGTVSILYFIGVNRP